MHETEQDKAHRRETSLRLSREGRKHFKFIEFDANEELVSEIRKHPFGLFVVLLTGGLITLAIFAVTVLAVSANLADFFGTDSVTSLRGVFAILGIILMVGAIIATFIAAYLYQSYVIYITSEKIAQVNYPSLFNRKISQLSIGDVQDVTVTKKGVFAYIFNYGTLVIETAGEQENYTFTYVPDPYSESKAIVGAHERNLVKHGN